MWIAPIAMVGILLVSAIGGGVVMLLWNWLMPPLFGRPEVTFAQAFGLLVLCRILFGGGGRHGFHRPSWTAEEKARFRQRVRERLGLGPAETEPRT
jgi:hypothetical protein